MLKKQISNVQCQPMPTYLLKARPEVASRDFSYSWNFSLWLSRSSITIVIEPRAVELHNHTPTTYTVCLIHSYFPGKYQQIYNNNHAGNSKLSYILHFNYILNSGSGKISGSALNLPSLGPALRYPRVRLW